MMSQKKLEKYCQDVEDAFVQANELLHTASCTSIKDAEEFVLNALNNATEKMHLSVTV